MSAPLGYCPGVPRHEDPTGAARRCLDLIVAGTALVVCLPLMLAIGVLVRLTSPGPALYRQVRVGHGGRLFVLWKFRTMRAGADDRPHREYVRRLLTDDVAPHGGVEGVYKLARDPRVTAVGAWLRRASLDELPQLYNVLRGDMSLVGPRPALDWEVAYYDPRHLERFRVRPGMTGLWQVQGRSGVKMREALDLDVAYVRGRSLRLDLAILVRTAGVVLTGLGAR